MTFLAGAGRAGPKPPSAGQPLQLPSTACFRSPIELLRCPMAVFLGLHRLFWPIKSRDFWNDPPRLLFSPLKIGDPTVDYPVKTSIESTTGVSHGKLHN
jgi:hypothetical protein